MKKTCVLFTILAGILSFNAAFGNTDFSKSIAGNWNFDMGGGFMATVEYRSEGTLTQKMGDLTISGTYKVQGNKLTTIVKGQTTVFTILSADDSTMTIKRDKDGKTIVYKR